MNPTVSNLNFFVLDQCLSYRLQRTTFAPTKASPAQALHDPSHPYRRSPTALIKKIPVRG